MYAFYPVLAEPEPLPTPAPEIKPAEPIEEKKDAPVDATT